MKTRARQLRLMTILGRIEQRGGRHLLHLRRGDVQLNAAAATLLSLCDGTRDLTQIIRAFALRHSDANRDQTRRFLEIAAELGWVECRFPARSSFTREGSHSSDLCSR